MKIVEHLVKFSLKLKTLKKIVKINKIVVNMIIIVEIF